MSNLLMNLSLHLDEMTLKIQLILIKRHCVNIYKEGKDCVCMYL